MISPLRRKPRPLYLERIPYRRRRLRDAARLLPIAGVLLLLLPLVWAPDPEGLRISRDLIYLFVTWAALVAVAAVFARGLSRQSSQDEPED